ncbi:hypothetical protein LWI28_018881 [Acer negundo]|uniref:Uncharacterized protein n=1 Tax=Acer negundo TaxID=4023 RepID=A0AAD5IEV6_ACENE|nr:hypothetical protein LWI28_018881 [Acer negundo]
MLIVLTGDHPCPMFVKVSDRSRVFKVSIEKEEDPIDFAWVTEMLDLKFESEIERGFLFRTRGVHHIRKVLSGKLVLEKGVTDRNRGYKEDSCTSLTESSSEEGQLGTFGGNRGECSKWARVNSGDGLSKELSSPIRIQKRSSSDSLIEGRGTVVRRVVPRQVLVNQNIRRVGADHRWRALSDYLEMGLFIYLWKIWMEEKISKKRRYMRKDYSVKKHGMRTRNGGCDVEESRKDGQRNNKRKGLKELARNFEEETSKVIEIGVALGFDFKGKENEVVLEVARREREDEESLALEQNRKVQ